MIDSVPDYSKGFPKLCRCIPCSPRDAICSMVTPNTNGGAAVSSNNRPETTGNVWIGAAIEQQAHRVGMVRMNRVQQGGPSGHVPPSMQRDAVGRLAALLHRS